MDERTSVPIRPDPPAPDALLDALRETEQLFSYGFDNAPIGMSLTRLDGTYFRVNQAFCRLLGRSEDELLRA
jgi:PAS domain-containing protein